MLGHDVHDLVLLGLGVSGVESAVVFGDVGAGWFCFVWVLQRSRYIVGGCIVKVVGW
ncbi:hypothetical protein IMCC1989_421 [gamma proteobacterium IMCC1989]|nr:hypothetical protein IMCC1989_421 [gamma proteobacterium IMCC1989]